MDIQAKKAALEALRLQRKGEVEFENQRDQARLEELEREGNAILISRQQRVAAYLIENAKYEGQLELLDEQLGAEHGNHAAE